VHFYFLSNFEINLVKSAIAAFKKIIKGKVSIALAIDQTFAGSRRISK